MSIPTHSSLNSRNALDDCDHCHYCDLAFGRFHHEHDHAPVPRCADGTATVPTCSTCHDLKDRAGFRGWPLGEYARAVDSLIKRGLFGDTLLGSPLAAWPEQWSEMGRWERLAWGRIVALSHRSAPPEELLWAALKVSA